MRKEIQEIEDLSRLLAIEKEEDFTQYKTLIQSLPLSKRVEKGYTWYPLTVVQQGFTFGERAFVILEKSEKEVPHQFRSGKTVSLFTLQTEVKGSEQRGVVHFVKKNQIKIILNSNDLPDWLRLGQIGLDLLFDERTYLEMEKALKILLQAKQNRLAELRSTILGYQKAQFGEKSISFSSPVLNPSQNQAVDEIVASRDLAVIHGPPGTGKTTTIVQAVKVLSETENCVLVTAPSNTAVDLLTTRLAKENLRVVRIGNISRVEEETIMHTLEMQLAKHPESKNIKKVKIEAAECRRKARKFKRRFGKNEYDERKRLFAEARELMQWANQLEDRLINQILEGAQVITATLVGSAHPVLGKMRFRTVIIDEAAQALEPASWIPILKASRVVLTGDPFQLPPTVKSIDAQRQGLSLSLIEKCLQRHQRNHLLNIQYRMHETIMGFSNQQFYEGQLHAHQTVAQAKLAIEDNFPLLFVDTAGCGFEELVNEVYKSRYNPGEFQILCEHLYQLIAAYDGQEIPPIAIISPYKEQVLHMNKILMEDPLLMNLPITINTIDGFQGQEREIVYISLVRSNDKGEIGFLNDYRRINVAMTRAKKQLIIIGDSATIGGSPFYEALLEYCEKEGNYKTAWEYMQV